MRALHSEKFCIAFELSQIQSYSLREDEFSMKSLDIIDDLIGYLKNSSKQNHQNTSDINLKKQEKKLKKKQKKKNDYINEVFS